MDRRAIRGALVRKGIINGLYCTNNISSNSNHEVLSNERLKGKHSSTKMGVFKAIQQMGWENT